MALLMLKPMMANLDLIPNTIKLLTFSSKVPGSWTQGKKEGNPKHAILILPRENIPAQGVRAQGVTATKKRGGIWN